VAELELPFERWLALKLAAANSNLEYETGRRWCAEGLVSARKEGGRWFVDDVSLQARLKRLRA
jgi:hypothetical protein